MLLTEEKEIQNSRSELEQIDQKMQQSLDALKINCQTRKSVADCCYRPGFCPGYVNPIPRWWKWDLKTIMMRRWTYYREQARPILNNAMNAAQKLADLNKRMGNAVIRSLTDNSRRYYI